MQGHYYKANPRQELILPGNANVSSRAYSMEDIYRVVRLQANIRRFLAQRRLYHILMNPEQYLAGSFSSQYEEKNPVNYDNPIV